MTTYRVHRVTCAAMLAFSAIALLTVTIGLLQPPHPPATDEGTLAHIFQLSVAAFLPAFLLFFATADWKDGRRSALLVAVAVLMLALAFAGVYTIEHPH